jgi:hypothetical protein
LCFALVALVCYREEHEHELCPRCSGRHDKVHGHAPERGSSFDEKVFALLMVEEDPAAIASVENMHQPPQVGAMHVIDVVASASYQPQGNEGESQAEENTVHEKTSRYKKRTKMLILA